MKKIFNYLIYISIVFLIVTLVRGKYISFPHNIKYTYLIPSFLLLFAGFLSQAWAYKIILKKFDCPISLNDALKAFGLYTFSKYIPGKIWMLLGPASYIKKKYNYATDKLVTISFTSEFISVWLVLTISSFLVIIFNLPILVKLLCLVFWLGLTLTLFTRFFHNLGQSFLLNIFKKNINLPSLTFKYVISLLPVNILYWSLYAISFYFLSLSFGVKTNYLILFTFPLATVIGMIAFIFPGGLGIREGTLVLLLVSANISGELATSISMASRIWFLFGEVFIFLIGLSINIFDKISDKKNERQKA